MQVTVAEMELMGETIGVTIVMADADTEPLLGLTAMESAGLAVDPGGRELYKRPSINLKESTHWTNGWTNGRSNGRSDDEATDAG